MKRPKILHVLYGDKFTRPFMAWMDTQFSKEVELVFVCLDEQSPNKKRTKLRNGSAQVFLQLPLKKNLIWNLFTLLAESIKADKIVWHGNPVLFFWGLFPFLLKKCNWIIYGGMDMYLKESVPNSFQNRLKKFVLKRVAGHITHIKGDAAWCNAFYGSKAVFFDNPIYLSNIVQTSEVAQDKPAPINSKPGILVGNSFDSSNNHLEVFEWLLPLKGSVKVICPLSYGSDIAYKNKVIETGNQLFGDDFLALDRFLPLAEYIQFLEYEVQAVVFNHKRQEAMGVTLQLLAMQKPVFVFPETTAFSSLLAKGIQLQSNNRVKENPFLLLEHLPQINQNQVLNKHYSEQSLIDAWRVFHAA